MTPDPDRWAWAAIDPTAIAHNVGVLSDAADGAQLWAVVKADGYGHGAVTVARAALDGGATGLCVALAQEAMELRGAGLTAPMLVLTEQPSEQIDGLLGADVQLVAYRPTYVDLVGDAAQRRGVRASVHLHIDTGMSRVGCRPQDAVTLAQRIDALPALRRVGTMTHLACADEPTQAATGQQLEVFRSVLADLTTAGLDAGMVHASNSAATLAFRDAHFDAVRTGIALYGISPGEGVDQLATDLRPAMTLAARVSFVKRVPPGTHVNYGWRYETVTETTLVTVPLGYADGVRRSLGSDRAGTPGMDVLIGGCRHPIVGVVTMDQLVVDVGDADVSVGDEVVLIGSQGDDQITATDWATHLDTIGYEIVCGIGPRVPRVVTAPVGAPRPAGS